MKRPILLGLAATAAACGGNWSAEDIDFIRSIPTRQDLTLASPAAAGQQKNPLAADETGTRRDALGQSTVYRGVIEEVNGVNDGVAAVTGWLDVVRTVPPSVREQDRRAWGPYSDKERPGIESVIFIERVDTEVYHWAIQQRRKGGGDWTSVAGGVFQGERAKDGKGEIHFDFVALRGLGIDNDPNLARIDLGYDMTGSEARVVLQAAGVDGTSAKVGYVVREDGSGEIGFRIDANMDWTPDPRTKETLEVYAKWLADGSGRSAVKVSGGDLGAVEGLYGECWNPDQQQVFTARNFGCPAGKQTCTDPEGGTDAVCSIPTF